MGFFSSKKQTLVVPQESVLREHLEKISKGIFSRLKNELLGETETKLKSVLQKYRSVLASKVNLQTQAWTAWVQGIGPVLYPNYTRTYYRKGNTEVVLLEFPPQMRLVKFSPILAGKPDTGTSSNFSLALPYTYFAVKFVQGKFDSLYSFFSPTPIKNLTQKLCFPYLTNIDQTYRVCMGMQFKSGELVVGDINQQVSYIMHHFWNSIFSTDIVHFWNIYKSHFEGTDLESLDKWQAASLKDPLFVLDANWRETGESCGDIIRNLFRDNQEVANLQQDIFQKTYDAILAELEIELTKMFDSVDPSQNLDGAVQQLSTSIASIN